MRVSLCPLQRECRCNTPAAGDEEKHAGHLALSTLPLVRLWRLRCARSGVRLRHIHSQLSGHRTQHPFPSLSCTSGDAGRRTTMRTQHCPSCTPMHMHRCRARDRPCGGALPPASRPPPAGRLRPARLKSSLACRILEWKAWHSPTSLVRAASLSSISRRNLSATASSASLGQIWNLRGGVGYGGGRGRAGRHAGTVRREVHQHHQVVVRWRQMHLGNGARPSVV